MEIVSTLGNYIHYNWKNYQLHGTSFDNKGSNGMAVLKSVHNSILKKVKVNKKNKTNMKELEDCLNGIVYSRGDNGTALHQKYVDFITSEFYGMFLKWAVNLEKGIEVAGTAASSESFKFGEKTGFHTNNVQGLKAQCEQAIQQLRQYPNEKGLNEVKRIMQILENAEKVAQDTTLTGKNSDWASYKNMSEDKASYYRNIISQLNESLAKISAASKNQVSGELFEAVAVIADDSVRKSLDAKIDWTLQKDLILSGKKTDTMHMTLENYHPQTRAAITKAVRTRDAEATMELTPGNIEQDVIFKADAQIKFNDEDYRLSMKNYQLKDYKDIGMVSETPFLTSLLRVTGADFVNHAFNILFSLGESDAVQAKQRAEVEMMIKRIFAIEALSGISQKNGYADTLVVNNRSQSQIRVVAISDLVPKAGGTLDGWYISGLPSFTRSAAEKYNEYVKGDKGWGLAQRRIDNLLTEMHSYKISVKMNSNKIFA